MLFDLNKDRSTAGVKVWDYSYKCFDEAVGPAADAFRAKANLLLEAYPESKRQGILNQLKVKRPTAFGEFLFELLVYNQLLQAGVKVLEIEPRVGNGKQPDFLCEQNGSKFFVEVVTAHYPGRALKIIDELCHKLKQCPGFGWRLDLKVCQMTDEPLDLNAIVSGLKQTLYLNRDKSRCVYLIEDKGWSIGIQATRDSTLKTIRLGCTEYPEICTRMGNYKGSHQAFPEYTISPALKLSEVILDKARKYGTLPYPLIVFVNNVDRSTHWSMLSESVEFVMKMGTLVFSDFSESAMALKTDSIEQRLKRAPVAGLDSIVVYHGAMTTGKGIRCLNSTIATPELAVLDRMPSVYRDKVSQSLLVVENGAPPVPFDDFFKGCGV